MIDSTSKLDDWTRTFHETLQSVMEKKFLKKKMDYRVGVSWFTDELEI